MHRKLMLVVSLAALPSKRLISPERDSRITLILL